MKRRLTIVFFASVLVATSAYLLMRQENSKNYGDIERVASPALRASDPPFVSVKPESVTASNPDTSQKPEEFCGKDPTCVDDPLVPNSEAELRWMRQNGFPSKHERERLARLSNVELEAEAKRGVLTAMTELGGRMVKNDDSNGMLWFLRAKNGGSIYAYYEQSKAETIPSMGHGYVEAGAFLRVAYILGDSKADRELYRFVERNRLGVAELHAIDRRAAELYQTYARNRQPTPRPL